MNILSDINSFLLENQLFELGLIIISFVLGFYTGRRYANSKNQASDEFRLQCQHSPNKTIRLKTINSKLIFNSCPYAKDAKFCKKLNEECLLNNNFS